MNVDFSSASSPWPHRWAVALACATFPLVWVGGLVTTTDAGMSVPDWPNTYGYNLLLYPWQTWLAGPWDIFVEHGHRLLATAVGLLTIALLVSLWRADERRWVRWLGAAALVLVILQGVLGGMRVLLVERMLAMVHGFTGPLFFAVAVGLVVVTSRRWRGGVQARHPHPSPLSATADLRPKGEGAQAGFLRRLAVVTAVLFYVQIVFGAALRHVPVGAEPTHFKRAVELHIFLAAVLLVLVAMVNWSVISRYRRELASRKGRSTLTPALSRREREEDSLSRRKGGLRLIRRLALALAGLTILQIVLGMATWGVKYASPYWLDQLFDQNWMAIQADGWLETHVITAHVAIGSLLLGTAVALALYTLRFTVAPQAAPAATATTKASA